MSLFDFLRRSTEHAPTPPPPVWKVHSLKDNFPLSLDQYAHCVQTVETIQKLYDQAPAYAQSHGLDIGLHFAANEWADIVQATGITFRKSYVDLNYLRLYAPFAGYHLPFLDRLDVRHFAESWNEEFLADFGRNGLREDVVEYLTARVDPAKRLAPFADDYLQHVRNVPSKYVVRTPRMFGEIGLEVGGVLFNPDVTLCQSRINGLLSSGILDKLHADIARRGRARVLEIGPGYGALGYALRTIFGERLEYIAIDLPTSLFHSALYLGTLAGGAGCHLLMPGDDVPERFKILFIANYLLDEFVDRLGPVDLTINTMSFTEMSPQQVRYYAAVLRQLLGRDGVVFDENAAVRPHHTDSKAIFAEIFPYRKQIASDVVTTKNWCQDLWASRYIGHLFDVNDHLLLPSTLFLRDQDE